ncbi:MAG TPA: hypothetical protein VGE98_07825 [Thermoanaerobaculia bacterium]
MRRPFVPVASVLWILSTGLAACPAAAAGDPFAAADAAWSRRAEGHRGPRAAAGPIDETIAACEQVVRREPDLLAADVRLLRALHFKGEYVAASRDDTQKVFGHGRDLAEAALDRLAARAGGRAALDKLSPQEAAKALKGQPEAAGLYLWAAVHWGLWGDAFGKLAAARQGAGDHIRRYSEIVIALDESFESAGGHRVLGRLHTLAPKVPFVTGWVDRGKAVSELRRAMALAPDFPTNQLFLADALLQFQPEKSGEARELLRRLAARQPSADFTVEDEDAAAKARQLLQPKS